MHRLSIVAASLLLSLGVFACTSNKLTESAAPVSAEKDVVKLPYVIKKDTLDLTIYYPQFSRVDLVCQYMPTPDTDKDAVFVCEAAFTGDLIDKSEFRHFNIAGNHVSGGKLHKGYRCGYNTGTFVFADGKWRFVRGTDDKLLQKVAKAGGMAFSQVLIIYNRQKEKIFRHDSYVFRALCSLGGKLCVIESADKIDYPTFVDKLVKLGVEHALYTDMGTGWNYAWYRADADNVVHIHLPVGRYTTNWITFYK